MMQITERREYAAIFVNPDWPYDVMGSFKPSENCQVPSDKVVLIEDNKAVVMLVCSNDDSTATYQAAHGLAYLPEQSRFRQSWKWRELEGPWRFYPPTKIHSGFDREGGGEFHNPMEFYKAVSEGKASFNIAHQSPYEYGADLKMPELRRQIHRQRHSELASTLFRTMLLALGMLLVATILFLILSPQGGA